MHPSAGKEQQLHIVQYIHFVFINAEGFYILNYWTQQKLRAAPVRYACLSILSITSMLSTYIKQSSLNSSMPHIFSASEPSTCVPSRRTKTGSAQKNIVCI